jgi:hypothetical protein
LETEGTATIRNVGEFWDLVSRVSFFEIVHYPIERCHASPSPL